MNLIWKLTHQHSVYSSQIDYSKEEMSEEQRTKLQGCLMSMFLDIQRVCEKYGLSAYLNYGSALGAVRHQGFIPWDDDLDISMTRRDYIRFCEVFEEELSDRYILNAPNYCKDSIARFPKVLLKDSRFYSLGGPTKRELQKIFLDIFILDNAPANKIVRSLKGVLCDAVMWIGGQVYTRENMDEHIKEQMLTAGKDFYYAKRFFGLLFSFLSAAEWNDLTDRLIQSKDEDSPLYTIATAHYFHGIIEKRRVGQGKKVKFEGTEALVFQDVEGHLRDVYGDYMQLPPEEDRCTHGMFELAFPKND